MIGLPERKTYCRKIGAQAKLVLDLCSREYHWEEVFWWLLAKNLE